MYDEGLPNILGNEQIFPHEEVISYVRLCIVCNCSILNFLIYEENFIFLFISVGSTNTT
jgi:hypothetical protein